MRLANHCTLFLFVFYSDAAHNKWRPSRGCHSSNGSSDIVSIWQVDHAKSLHYVGAGVAFPAGLLFVCLQCVLTYRLAVTALDYWMAHFRVALALGAMISLVFSILSLLDWDPLKPQWWFCHLKAWWLCGWPYSKTVLGSNLDRAFLCAPCLLLLQYSLVGPRDGLVT